MYLRYGTYSHETGECAITIQKESVLSAENNRIGWKEIWNISGMLRASTTSELTTKIRALETAYSVNGRDLVLLNDDGSETAHKLISNRSRTGVMIQKLDYPAGEGAEYTTFRNYTLIAECDFSILESFDIVGGGKGKKGGGISLSYNEVITYRGSGGPRIVVLETMGGDPVKQIVSKRTPRYKTQSGSATGLYAYPQIPPPLDPDNEISDRRVTQYDLPSTVSAFGKESIFRVNWSYEFVS